MTGTVKFFWYSLLFFALASCEKYDPYEDTPNTACPGGVMLVLKLILNNSQRPI